MIDKMTVNESIISLSEVTPSKKTKRGLMQNWIYLCMGVSVLILSFAFWPHKSTAREASDEMSSEQKELTLSQNLALIESMKQQTATAKGEQELIKPVFRTKPPKLRHSEGLSKEVLARMNAPTTFFNTSVQVVSQNTNDQLAEGASALIRGNSTNAEFMNQTQDITMVSAKRLPHPYHTVPAGEMIAATLETAIHSELPGMVRAITTRDIYSLMGENCLIPRGSTLVGQFNSSIVDGQSRILVVWNRVQLVNGVIVALNSPATDSIGRAGVGADYINRHFMERFSTSALLSILGAYSANSGVDGQDQYNSKSQYRSTLAASFQQASTQSLQANNNIKPTLQINQGTQITVFVAHDLDFNNVGAVSEGIVKSQRKLPWK